MLNATGRHHGHKYMYRDCSDDDEDDDDDDDDLSVAIGDDSAANVNRIICPAQNG